MVQLSAAIPARAGTLQVAAMAALILGACLSHAQAEAPSSAPAPEPAPTPSAEATTSTAATTSSATAAVSAATSATTATAAADSATTIATLPPVHLGRLTPADEPAAIARSMDRLTTVPGTDLQIGYRLGAPAGWYQLEGSNLVWHEPAPSDTHKLTVTVQDAADLRIVPMAKVTAGFTGPDGKAVTTTQTLNFLWDKDFYHYAANLALPDDLREADLHLRIEAPSFRRTDQVLGAFFARPVNWTFRGVRIPEPVRPEPKPGVPTTRGLFSEGRHPYVEPTPYPGSATLPESTGSESKTK